MQLVRSCIASLLPLLLVGCSSVAPSTASPQLVIQRGDVEGIPWEVVAYLEGDRLCTATRERPGQDSGEGGGCGPVAVLDQDAVFASMSGQPLVAHGLTSEEVVTVRLETTGDDVDVEVSSLAALGVPARAFAVAVPPGTEVESFVALDADGVEIGRAVGPAAP